jgi:general stress protein 26
MAEQHKIDRVWDIIEKVGVGILTTRFDGGLRARPLEARPEREAGLIWFVTDLRSGKEHEIEVEHNVGLVFIDHKEKAYLSLTARAEVRRDPAKACEIWKKTDSVWWKGPNDPNVCVLRVRPLTAELWDGPASKAIAAFEFAKARLTGKKPNLGENRKVTVAMTKPSSNYKKIWRAMRERKQITCVFDGKYREACPIILGYSSDGQERVLVFQFEGETSPTSQLPGWRSLFVSEISSLKLRAGPWSEGRTHMQTQPHIQFVDVDVNIPETLTRPQPLPFGSPHLLPPRGRKAA